MNLRPFISMRLGVSETANVVLPDRGQPESRTPRLSQRATHCLRPAGTSAHRARRCVASSAPRGRRWDRSMASCVRVLGTRARSSRLRKSPDSGKEGRCRVCSPWQCAVGVGIGLLQRGGLSVAEPRERCSSSSAPTGACLQTCQPSLMPLADSNLQPGPRACLESHCGTE